MLKKNKKISILTYTVNVKIVQTVTFFSKQGFWTFILSVGNHNPPTLVFDRLP